MKKYYVLMNLQKWDSVSALTPALLPVTGPGKSRGFLLVFDSLEDLRDFNRTANYVVIEEI